MSGVFPSGGTDPQNTLLAQVGLKVVDLCKALFYRTNCNPRFDPAATNALISEMVNAINALGVDYDCSKLNNLATAVLRGNRTDVYDHKFPDASDLIRGRFDNAEGHTTVKELLQLVPGVLDNTGVIDEDDYIVIGRAGQPVGGVDIIKGLKVRVSEFLEIVAPPPLFGAGWSWKNVRDERTPGTVYRNNRDVPIQLNIHMTEDKNWFYISENGDDWLSTSSGAGNSGEKNTLNIIIPPRWYYRNDGDNYPVWLELTPDT